MNPIRLLVIGYAIIVLAGTVLLSLPISSATGTRQSYVDALFMASSGISTCGLVVVDIGSYYSAFGQIVLMLIFQIGGMGYMAFAVLIAYTLWQKLSTNHRIAARESLSGAVDGHLRTFFLSVVVFTFVFELIGACSLYFYWSREYPEPRAVYLAIFHSISAFCTAGMSLFPSSFIPYRDSLALNIIIDAVSLAGAIGFFVLYDLYIFLKKTLRREYPNRLSFHSKVALLFTFMVILTGAVVIYVSEKWPASLAPGERLISSSFQAISASTTDGFNTMDVSAMSPTSLFMIILLMFVGASPGSTGGGIKTTTLAVIVIYCMAYLRNKRDATAFHKRIPFEAINKALVVFISFLAVAIVDILILTATEKGSFLQILFEVISALCNTGLSTGITQSLTTFGRIVIIATMFVGRIGPLTAGLFLIGESRTVPIRYSEGQIFIG